MSLPAFDYTDNVRRVCAHMVARLPELQHIELSRVAFSFSLARKRVRHGLLATMTPMRFQDGALVTQRHGRSYTAQRLFDKRGNEMLYILTVYLPRFQNQTLAEALATLLHELWHISPEFNGDLRRHPGRCYAHTHSQQEYDAQMAILARKNRVLTGVTFQRRFSPVIRYGKALCEKRGPVHSAVATFYKNAVGRRPYYRGAVDILTCDAIHAVDTLRYLCGGEVESVASDVRRLDAEHCNIHLALIKFSSGATGVLLTNWMTGRRMFTVEIHSPGISVFGEIEEGGKVFADGQSEPVEVLDGFEISGSKEGYRAFGEYDMNRHFIDCIQKGKQPDTNFEDATKTMELVDAIYQSQI